MDGGAADGLFARGAGADCCLGADFRDAVFLAVVRPLAFALAAVFFVAFFFAGIATSR